MADHVLVGTELRYTLGDRTILDGVSVHAEGGRLLAVRGPSGSGKSSLLALLGGLTTPTSGTVTLDGTTVGGGDLTLRRRIGLVLQGYGLVAALTARENISIALQAQRVPRDQIRSRVQAVLDEVGLAAIADRQIEDLSGGQQQRVAVARALVTDPEVLLTDEPTAELDSDSRARVVDLLVARARSGAVVVIASHDPDVVAACDDVLDLRTVTAGLVPATSHDTAPSRLDDGHAGRHRA